MTALAHATIVGRLGRDPETRAVGASGELTTVTVAVDRSTMVNGERRTATTWWRINVWGKRGQTLTQHCRRGDPIVATGYPELREWTDSTGAKRQTLELLDADWSFLPRRSDQASAPRSTAPSAAPTTPAPAVGDSAPTPAALDDEPPF